MKLSKKIKALLGKKPKGDTILTQQQMVARALLIGAKVSPLHALYKFGCFRLAAVIHTLRYDYHMAIKTTMTKVKTKYGTARVAIYTYQRRGHV